MVGNENFESVDIILKGSLGLKVRDGGIKRIGVDISIKDMTFLDIATMKTSIGVKTGDSGFKELDILVEFKIRDVACCLQQICSITKFGEFGVQSNSHLEHTKHPRLLI